MQLVLMLFALFVIASCNSKDSKDESFNAGIVYHTIELLVDTENIKNPNFEDYCSFTGQPAGEPDSAFTVDVKPGDIILWVGKSISSDDHEVLIESINYHGGPGSKDLLGKNVINNSNGVLAARIIKNAQLGDEEKYAISFRVINDKPGIGIYTIDPKLRIMH